MTDVVLMKLVSGEEVIGRLADTNEKALILEKARVLTVQPTPQGGMGLAMLPFLMGDPEGKCSIMVEAVIGEIVGSIPPELEKGYLQQTSTIQL